MNPKVLIPVALGTNRDNDLAEAFTLAGAEPHTVPLTALRSGEVSMADFQILAVPGGFSYGDALGAGRLFGLDLAGWFGDQLHEAVGRGVPIIGICNGFQALVRTGLLPGDVPSVLTENENGRFECRWVTLGADSANQSAWLSQLTEPIRCPIAHGEGRFMSSDLAAIEARGGVALRYLDRSEPAAMGYPANPNGSPGDVAGVTDASGLVLGMMPHPENHIRDHQDPLRGRPGAAGNALPLFRAGVAAAGG